MRKLWSMMAVLAIVLGGVTAISGSASAAVPSPTIAR